VTPVEAQLVFARAAVLLLLYAFLAVVALIGWRELRTSAAVGTRAPAAEARIVVLDGADSPWPAGSSFTLHPVTTVGRDLDCAIVLKDATLSGRHALLTSDEVGWWLEDLGSTNGSRVNGELVAPGERTPLRSGDELAFGAVRFRLVVPRGAT
jgi:hypothetical protein